MKQEKKRIIIKRECDVAMATKKRYFPCAHKCETCICCIEVEDDGDRCHYNPLRGITKTVREFTG